jgi:hypothetical protein
MYEKHLDLCFDRADNNLSNITESILQIEGMSGVKTRHFYNNVCSMKDSRYLEIGTWRGSSFCSAMCNNKMTCTCIDNWSEFGGPKKAFLSNFNEFKGENDATFIEDSCWNLDPLILGKFNIYMYDGQHSEESHFRAINHFLPCLDTCFIYLVDDWNWPDVQKGTFDSIAVNKLEVLYQKEIITLSTTDKEAWHNGIIAFVLRKPSGVRNI